MLMIEEAVSQELLQHQHDLPGMVCKAFVIITTDDDEGLRSVACQALLLIAYL
jgi:hypothetical protein